MTQHEQKPESAEFRTREEETAEYTRGMSAEFVSSVQHIHPDQDYSSLQAVSIYRHGYDLGAAEQRRKDAEGAEPVGYVKPCLMEFFRQSKALFTSASIIPKRDETHTEALYARPVNVAALEARVKELEGEAERRIYKAVAAERERCAKVCKDVRLNEISDPADWHNDACECCIRAIREGGEHG